MVATHALEVCAVRCMGSSPFIRTTPCFEWTIDRRNGQDSRHKNELTKKIRVGV